ncbi:HlyD family efflux transporter periplasmic adaptor subunit [Ferruginivarius sediminum]|uniref:HlyD family efflux transporter periplasmic adaptor subunit n=1 Tax=Ferruginivarius sediminum TaxID=2661937 RepID=A0A369TCQ8_9PROT|nr:HlyD family efflux transporter periplasmic adaptor subunit [Ferruginivarius sediminum]
MTGAAAVAATGGGGGGLPDVLPRLREDLQLLEGPAAADGAPSWTVFDPVRNSFFRIGRVAFLLLSEWHRGTPAEVVSAVNDSTTARVGAAQMAHLLRFLETNDLIAGDGPKATARHARRAAQARVSPWRWLLHRYLFFRIPLVRPDGFLDATLPLVRPLMTAAFVRLCIVLGLIGLILVIRQWEAFTHTFVSFFSWERAGWFVVALACAKVFHELAHGYVAKRFGCRVTTMGVAFLVFYPVLYTDTTDAWRLTSRRQRLLIGAAGMLAELMLALLATFAWAFLPDGPVRSATFLLATVTWTMTLLVNLNPFLRFDGYYLLSDWLGIQNLQARGFALGRWRLREALFGFGDPVPERFHARTHRLLLVYAYSTWVWRFFLFLGIALLVYTVFFKLLGLLLMTVELGWFIGRPIAAEFAVWWRRRGEMRLNLNTLIALAVLGGVVFLLAWPWQGRVEAPAVLQAERRATLYPPVAARIVEIHARRGARVRKGEVLYRLEAPELSHEIAQTRRRIALGEMLLRRQAASSAALQRLHVLEQELAADRTRLRGLLSQRARLTVRAPEPGLLVERPRELQVGQWVAPNQPLGRIVSPGKAALRGYVRGSDLPRFAPGAKARFYPEDPARPPLDARVADIESVNAARIDIPYVASVHGGTVAVESRRSRDAEAQVAGSGLVPREAVYRIELRPEGGSVAPQQVVRGAVMIDGEARSVIDRLWRTAAAVLVRESGF